jgi:hypothetical protein
LKLEVDNLKAFYNQGSPTEKYHKVENTNNMTIIKNIIVNLAEKLRNFNIILFIITILTIFRHRN